MLPHPMEFVKIATCAHTISEVQLVLQLKICLKVLFISQIFWTIYIVSDSRSIRICNLHFIHKLAILAGLH